MRAPTPTTAPAATTASVKVKDPALEQRIIALEEELKAIKAKNKELAEERTALKRSLSRMERRIEDYRQADIIAKGKVELAEDKLADWQKRYYNSVSELALLKGEVAPMPPKAPKEPKAEPAQKPEPNENTDK